MSQPNPSLYVGGLGADINEHALFEHFKEVGPIVSVRVCMDAQDNHKSLGYGYVNFQNPADADTALERLNATKLGSTYIRVCRVERDPSKRRSGQNNLVITHLPPQFDIPDLKDIFGKFGTIGSIHITTDENGKSHGYGHVQFTTAESAKAAIEEANGIEIDGYKITVTPYNHNYQEEKKKNFTNLYLRDFAPTVTEESLKAFMSKFGNVTSAAVRFDAEGKSMRFGFCSFTSHEEAAAAVEAVDGKVIPELSNEEEPVKADRFINKGERARMRERRRQQRRAENAKFPSLYVKNFDEETTDETLRNLFSRCGEVMSAHVMRDRASPNVSRGFGFVSVKDHTAAERCINELHGSQDISKAPLYVAFAMRRDARRTMIQQSLNQRRMPPMGAMGPMGGMFPGIAGPRLGYLGGNQNMMFNQGMMPQQRPIPQRQMPPRPMPPRPMPPQQIPPQAQPSLATIIANMPPDQAKNLLGERLYNNIIQKHPQEAAKVTGMLLEMDNSEILMLLESPDQLDAKVGEALEVLAHHQAM